MTQFDVEALAALMREAALAEIMPRFRKLGEADIRIKTEASDLATSTSRTGSGTAWAWTGMNGRIS